MEKRRRLLGVVVVMAIVAATLAAQLVARAAPAEEQAVDLAIQMAGATEGGGRQIAYTITLVNGSSLEVRDVYVTGKIPSGAKLSAASATPAGSVFKGEEAGAAAWVSPVVPAGGKLGPFTYKVDVTQAPAGSAHAWVRWLSPSEGVAVSDDITWRMATSAGAPRRGCLSCHVLVDKEKGNYTLAYEAHERTEVDLGREHPSMAPDGTSIKATDETGADVCLQCHRSGTGQRTGMGNIAPMALRDIVHPAHMFSQTFVEHYGGGCFTCHNVRGDGTFELLSGKVDANEKGLPRSLISGEGRIPGSIPPSEGSR